jgi:hypothetical protein
MLDHEPFQSTQNADPDVPVPDHVVLIADHVDDVYFT